MKKKSVLFTCLMLVFSIIIGLSMTGCSSKRSMYGKTYVYDGYEGSFTAGLGSNDGTETKTYDEIIEEQLNNIDWQKTLSDDSFSENVTTLERAKETISTMASSLDDKFSSYRIAFGAKGENTVEINGASYQTTDEDGLGTSINLSTTTDSYTTTGYFSFPDLGGKKDNRISFTYETYNSNDQTSTFDGSVYVTVYFKTNVTYFGYEHDSISITYYALFKEA